MIKIFGLKFIFTKKSKFNLLWSKIYNHDYRRKENSIYCIAKDSPTAMFIEGCQYNFKLPLTMYMYHKLPVIWFIHFPKGVQRGMPYKMEGLIQIVSKLRSL